METISADQRLMPSNLLRTFIGHKQYAAPADGSKPGLPAPGLADAAVAAAGLQVSAGTAKYYVEP